MICKDRPNCLPGEGDWLLYQLRFGKTICVFRNQKLILPFNILKNKFSCDVITSIIPLKFIHFNKPLSSYHYISVREISNLCSIMIIEFGIIDEILMIIAPFSRIVHHFGK